MFTAPARRLTGCIALWEDSGAVILLVLHSSPSFWEENSPSLTYIAYYDVFKSCKPKNAVLFLVLSIVFDVTLPFFVFGTYFEQVQNCLVKFKIIMAGKNAVK